MKQYWTRTIQAANDLSDPDDLYKAVTIDGDFASNGREAFGILVEGASSGRNVTVAVAGLIPYASIAVISAGAALAVNGSGEFVLLTAVDWEVGMALGQKGVDAAVVTSNAIGEGNFDFAVKHYTEALSSGVFI